MYGLIDVLIALALIAGLVLLILLTVLVCVAVYFLLADLIMRHRFRKVTQ